jgi:predicted amidohydrolase
MRIAIAQIPMKWELAANLQAIRHAMQVARDGDAALCAFSELALTGFHRRIVEWARPELVLPALAQVREDAARLGLAVALGAPSFDQAGERFNSHMLIDESGAVVATVAKNGLTEPEASFFKAGGSRPVGVLAGARCTAVICREVEDHASVVSQLAGTAVHLILWPGQMRPDPARPIQDPPVHVLQAQALAQAVGAFVVQTNWPNALNRPEESEHTGHSACISPTGELLFRLPKQGFGLGLFTLGERTYEWRPDEV